MELNGFGIMMAVILFGCFLTIVIDTIKGIIQQNKLNKKSIPEPTIIEPIILEQPKSEQKKKPPTPILATSNGIPIEEPKQELINLENKLRKEYKEQFKKYDSEIGRLQQKVSSLEQIIEICPVPVEIVINAQPDNPDKHMLYWSCERKVQYKSRTEAALAEIELSERYNQAFKIYHCRYCGKHHLAKQLNY
jgi:hypothetical protein